MACTTADEDLLVLSEIRRLLKETGRTGILSVTKCAEQIKRDFPRSAFTEYEIADEIIMSAAEAGIPVQIGPADRTTHAER
jgi:hypothetical protein